MMLLKEMALLFPLIMVPLLGRVQGPSGVRGLTSDEVLASGILEEQWSVGK